MQKQNPQKEALRALVKAYKTKVAPKKQNILQPYRQEIQELRFKKNASLTEIWELLDKTGIKTSKLAIAKFCKSILSGKSVSKEVASDPSKESDDEAVAVNPPQKKKKLSAKILEN